MPRTAGVYSLPAGNPVVTLTTIQSAWANTTMSDIATALTGSLPTDGTAAMTGALRLAAGLVGAPGLTFSAETTSGLYRNGAGDVRISIASNDVLRFTALGLIVPRYSANTLATMNVAGASGITTFINNTKTGGLAISGSAGTTDYDIIDFLNSAGNLAGRIGVIAAGGGGSLVIGTSNNYASGITNSALTIDQNGGIQIAAPSTSVALQVTAVTGNFAISAVVPASGAQTALRAGVIAGTNNPRLEVKMNEGTPSVTLDLTGSTTPTGIIATGGTTRASIDNLGRWTFSVSSSGIPVTIVNASGQNQVLSLGTSSSSFGASMNMFGSSSNQNWQLNSSTGGAFEIIPSTAGGGGTFTNPALSIAGATSLISGRGTVAAALVDMSPDSGTFTGTLTGCTTSPTATFTWRKMGNLVMMHCNAGLTATSNSTTMTITGLPAAIQPAVAQTMLCRVTDNTVGVVGVVQFNNTGTINFGNGAAGGAFTAAGTKGIGGVWASFTYALN